MKKNSENMNTTANATTTAPMTKEILYKENVSAWATSLVENKDRDGKLLRRDAPLALKLQHGTTVWKVYYNDGTAKVENETSTRYSLADLPADGVARKEMRGLIKALRMTIEAVTLFEDDNTTESTRKSFSFKKQDREAIIPLLKEASNAIAHYAGMKQNIFITSADVKHFLRIVFTGVNEGMKLETDSKLFSFICQMLFRKVTNTDFRFVIRESTLKEWAKEAQKAEEARQSEGVVIEAPKAEEAPKTPKSKKTPKE